MDTMYAVLVLLLLLYLLILFLLSLVPAYMADKRGRSYVGWLIFSMLFSPILGIILVACLGETEERRRDRILEEEEFKHEIERRYAESDVHRSFNPTGKTVNDMYKK